ncbi:MAG: ACT domain-containing protein, partial [Halieaceae bacterium]|nr:ACT domain-containing protein [Halieaceae bacterium]
QPISEDGGRLAYIRQYLSDELENKSDQPATSARLTPRKMKSFSVPTETRMSIDKIKNQSVLEVLTPDRPGLLARLGKIFVSLNIEVQAAKIQTLGERVEDVFFITDTNQQAITDPAVCENLQSKIREELDELAAA